MAALRRTAVLPCAVHLETLLVGVLFGVAAGEQHRGKVAVLELEVSLVVELQQGRGKRV